MIFVKLLENGHDVQDYRFDKPVVTVGAEASDDVRLEKSSGARLTIEGETLRMNASGDVRLNGTPAATAVLDNGDVIAVGPYELRFYHSKPVSAVAFGDTRTWKVDRPRPDDGPQDPSDSKTIKL